MFTGIVETTGILTPLPGRGSTRRVRVTFSRRRFRLRPGDSVAVSGVCLTATRIRRGGFEADLGPETIARTTLGSAAPGTRVNLERPLAQGARLGGHLVLGHVDGVGRVARMTRGGRSAGVEIAVAPTLARYLPPRGSACVDGVSLTIAGARRASFRVLLVPHTRRVTTLGRLRVGDRVNLECDVLARYVERQLGRGRGRIARLPRTVAALGVRT